MHRTIIGIFVGVVLYAILCSTFWNTVDFWPGPTPDISRIPMMQLGDRWTNGKEPERYIARIRGVPFLTDEFVIRPVGVKLWVHPAEARAAGRALKK